MILNPGSAPRGTYFNTPAKEGGDLPVPPTQEEQELAAFETFAKANEAHRPSNFKTTDEWVNSWKNLRASYTRATQELADLKKKAEPPKVEPKKEDSPASLKVPVTPKADESAEIDMDALEAEFEANDGKLTDETRNKLKTNHKLSDSMIDRTIGVMKREAAERVSAAAEVLGGQPELNKLLKWTQTNLSEAEKNAADKGFKSPLWKETLLGLQARMNQGKPPEPGSDVPGKVNSNQGGSVTPYSSVAMMSKDINDPRYRNDPDFRKQVESKIRLGIPA